MKNFLLRIIVGAVVCFCVNIAELKADDAGSTAGGWEKYSGNPVLGGDLGTCFDISVLKEGVGYRMWFSWRHDACYKPCAVFDGAKWLLWYDGRHGGAEQIGVVFHPGRDLGF